MAENEKGYMALAVFVWLLFVASIVLIVLRLFGVIKWSWWLVTSLVWAPAVLIVLSVIIGLIVFSIQVRKEKRAKK